jgi:hypothetical protein
MGKKLISSKRKHETAFEFDLETAVNKKMAPNKASVFEKTEPTKASRTNKLLEKLQGKSKT